MNSGVPPTLLKARTGELTPPGMTGCASAKRRRLVETSDGSAMLDRGGGVGLTVDTAEDGLAVVVLGGVFGEGEAGLSEELGEGVRGEVGAGEPEAEGGDDPAAGREHAARLGEHLLELGGGGGRVVDAVSDDPVEEVVGIA